ncbi:hypothetical protein AGABI1DRAFT_112217 [Agaricus bisporus var. burnettii JB137-S8]|uniref:Uncharacterized protein n=1 Tax=Agaricus bisporus var. burnettii (strain JB137-S8 / ATCC MYA-4627 / FGSC 10392) TaxID=597362 RepID=K5XFD3_AGABU|nr:uncharacterized protein AGABI1DRAFT_112217 [Agaricus bisporus var. burnettii JB137-S8]EKM82088.1 hypothetical protein AGABI1DRAFT_112217 [Agaricus bisporus var. burnettii JB137-S8]
MSLNSSVSAYITKNHVSVRLPQPQTIRDENINSCQVAIGVTKTLAAAGGVFGR